MAVIKNNAYEYGGLDIAETSIEAGATWLGVTSLDEALAMRMQLSQFIPILVLGYVSPEHLSIATRHNITLTAVSLHWIEEAAKVAKQPFDFHLKLDTGMNRIGCKTLDEVKSVIEIVSNNTYMNFTGVYTHFADSENVSNKTYFLRQLGLFEKLLTIIPQRGNKIIHCANSAATLYQTEKPFFDMVRVGLGWFGALSTALTPFPLQRTQVALYSTLILVKLLQAGERISYGGLYTTTRKQWIGTIPIGYGDAWQSYFNNTEVLIDGKLMPIVGRITLDQCMVALDKEYPVGTLVTFNRIQYGFTFFTSRLPRVYFLNDTVVSVRNPLLPLLNLNDTKK